MQGSMNVKHYSTSVFLLSVSRTCHWVELRPIYGSALKGKK